MEFDWTKVEGYSEDMTAEQKLELLNNLPDPEPANEPEVQIPKGAMISKAQFDKVSSELASVKKQLRSRMTEDEAKEAERVSTFEAMQLELETMRKEKTLNSYKANFMGLGYDAQMAEDIATAMAENDMDTVFALQRKQKMLDEKALRAKILKETPTPPAGDDVTDAVKAQKEMADLRKAFGLA